MEKRVFNKNSAAAFVAEGLCPQREHPAEAPLHACCVDGRCAEGQMHELAAPGGDMELVLAALLLAQARRAKGLVTPSVAELWSTTVSFLGGHLCVHSDTHVPEGAPRYTGCGHVRHALEDAAAYGMEAADAEELAALLAQELSETQSRPAVRCDTYSGDHREGAVFVNESGRRMEAHTNAHGQAFVFDAARAETRLRAFACAIAGLFGVRTEDEEALGSLTEELLEAAAKQREETLRRLAEGLPVFRVATDKGGAVAVEPLGTITPRQKTAEAAD